MSDGMRLLINSTPLWQQPEPNHPLPVHVQQVYTVMGQSNKRWQTILSSTNDLYTARDAMIAANDTGLFDRIVISEGKSVNRAPASRWTTIECALPKTLSFTTLMEKIEERTANNNPVKLPKHAFVVGHKQPQNVLLGLACVLAAALQSPFALAFVALLAIVDCSFLLNTAPISVDKARFFNRTRNWTYAILNGAFLLALIF